MSKSNEQINDSPGKERRLGGKLRAKLFRRRAGLSPVRITSDNIDEHRQSILARGRRLKYPVQYSKKRLLVVTVMLVIVATTGFGLWLQNALYRQQQTSNFYYNVTKVLPLSVASVDGHPVRYQDYLRRLRADIYYYINRERRSFNSKEGGKELAYLKRKDLQVTEKAAYVEWLAGQSGVSVSDSEVDAKIKSMREADGATKDDLTNTLQSFYGWTLDDYRATIKDQMLSQKLSYLIDQQAKSKIDKAKRLTESGVDFAQVAKDMSDDDAAGANVNRTVSLAGRDPTGMVKLIQRLESGQTTSVQKVCLDSSDYYYIAKLINKNKKEMTYQLVMVKLTKLDQDFAKLRQRGVIKEYINVPSDSSFASKEN